MNPASTLLFTLAVKATVILVAAFLSTLALRRAPASSRRFLWILTAVSLLALPVLSLLIPPLKFQPPPMTQAISFNPAPAASSVVVIPGVAMLPAPKPAPRQIPWLTLLWFVGIVAVAGHLAAGIARMSWLARKAARIDPPEDARRLAATLGVTRVAFFESDRVAMPLTWGIFRPRVLLPENRSAWPVDRQHLVLAHELIHVQQRDCFFQLLMQFACALYWFHPLMWLAAAQFRRERERACDDGVIRLGINGPEYAGHLLDLARSLKPAPRPVLAVAMAHQSNLESRVLALLDAKVNRAKLNRRAAIAAALTAICLLLPLASVRAQNGVATISGTVYDASGAVIPRANVLLNNLDTQAKEVAVTNPAGVFQLNSIPAAHYALEVSTPGFKIYRRNVLLQSNVDQRLDIIMDVGGITEQVKVTAPKPANTAALQSVRRRIKVGGMVQAAKLISRVEPIYPETARQRGIEGPVLLQAVVSTTGDIISVQILNSADPDLARAASNAVEQWRYQPTLLNGEPVEVITTITVDFTLQ